MIAIITATFNAANTLADNLACIAGQEGDLLRSEKTVDDGAVRRIDVHGESGIAHRRITMVLHARLETDRRARDRRREFRCERHRNGERCGAGRRLRLRDERREEYREQRGGAVHA